MNTRNKTLILWSAALILLAMVGFNVSKKNKSHITPTTQPTPLVENSFQQTPAVTADTNQVSPKQSAAIKTYNNPEYEFKFTYPASLGEVTVKTSECKNGGRMSVGSFSRNAKIDFGYVSSDYQKCGQGNFSLFEILRFTVLEKELELYTSENSSGIKIKIESTIPTTTPNIIGYVIKNDVEKDGQGNPAVILKSPSQNIGALVFRTHGQAFQDGIKLLKAVIQY